ASSLAGSVVDIDFETVGDKKCFKRFFISLVACSKGFIAGCHPSVSLDVCHLKGKFNGVLAPAKGIDGNNGLFPIAYVVLESKNGNSLTWFLESLKIAIEKPDALFFIIRYAKGIRVAVMHVYPNVEHIEWHEPFVEQLQETISDEYALEVATMPGKDKWVHLQTEDKIYPPVIKHPIGRPRKKRIAVADEPKKRHRCKECGGYGHRQNSCKNPSAESDNPGATSATKRRRRKKKS
nr:hypothetical protein [Tanacetum cinerariifolium]GEY37930.1 hypothetical protein [Tanacetum cinerariifolium]